MKRKLLTDLKCFFGFHGYEEKKYITAELVFPGDVVFSLVTVATCVHCREWSDSTEDISHDEAVYRGISSENVARLKCLKPDEVMICKIHGGGEG